MNTVMVEAIVRLILKLISMLILRTGRLPQLLLIGLVDEDNPIHSTR